MQNEISDAENSYLEFLEFYRQKRIEYYECNDYRMFGNVCIRNSGRIRKYDSAFNNYPTD